MYIWSTVSALLWQYGTMDLRYCRWSPGNGWFPTCYSIPYSNGWFPTCFLFLFHTVMDGLPPVILFHTVMDGFPPVILFHTVMDGFPPVFLFHTVMDGFLPRSLKHIISNAEYYGPSLFLLATDLVTVYVFQEPSMLSSLQANGLTDVVLQALLIKDVRTMSYMCVYARLRFSLLPSLLNFFITWS